MAKKKVNRKKQLRKQFAAMKKAGKMMMDAAGSAVETATERVQEVVETVKEKVVEGKEVVQKATKKAEASLEDLTEELTGLAAARVETFYEEGIRTAKDFSKWTEKELLALKGIGPATIKQLKELGIKLKG